MLLLYYGLTDPRTPAYAVLPALAALLYLVSPVDLIPDFIPGVGFLDDLVIVPLLLRMSVRLFPQEVLQSSIAKSAKQSLRIHIFLFIMLLTVALMVGVLFFLAFKIASRIF
jgi:uncharacterized membrane protein YkvA (DUF1232 family)